MALTIYPLGYAIWVSFINYDFSVPGHGWVGLDNFRAVWSDPIARHALLVTLGLAFSIVAVELVLGLLLALAMVRPFRGRRVLTTLFVVPLFVSPVIVGTFFGLILTTAVRPYELPAGKAARAPGNHRLHERLTLGLLLDHPRRRMAMDTFHVRDSPGRADLDLRRPVSGG